MKKWKLAGFYLSSSILLIFFFFFTVDYQWQKWQKNWLQERAQQQLRLFAESIQTYHHRLLKDISRMATKRNAVGGALSASDWQSLPSIAFMVAWDFSRVKGEGPSIRWKENQPAFLKEKNSYFSHTFKESDWTEIRLEQFLNEKVTTLDISTSPYKQASLFPSIRYTYAQGSKGNYYSILLLSIPVNQRLKNLNLLVLFRPNFFQNLVNSQKGFPASFGLLTKKEGLSLAHDTYPLGVLPTKHRAIVQRLQKDTSTNFSQGFFRDENGQAFFAAYEPISLTNLYAFWTYPLSLLPFYMKRLHFSLYLSLALLSLLFVPFLFLLYRWKGKPSVSLVSHPSQENLIQTALPENSKASHFQGKDVAHTQKVLKNPESPKRVKQEGNRSNTHNIDNIDNHIGDMGLSPISSLRRIGIGSIERIEGIEDKEGKEQIQKKIFVGLYHAFEKLFRESLSNLKAHAKTLQFKREVDPRVQGNEILEEARKISENLEVLGDVLGERVLSEDKEVQINKCIENVLKDVLHLLEKKNISLKFNLMASESWKIKGNAAQLNRAFKALIMNSIRAMETSMVRELRLSSFQEGENACIRIEDQGEGIPQEYREKVFEPFFSLSASTIGMGLTLAKEVFSAHKMNLCINNEKKSGCVLDILFKTRIIIQERDEDKDKDEDEDNKRSDVKNSWITRSLFSLKNLKKSRRKNQ